jgi:hypothetical protein
VCHESNYRQRNPAVPSNPTIQKRGIKTEAPLFRLPAPTLYLTLFPAHPFSHYHPTTISTLRMNALNPKIGHGKRLLRWFRQETYNKLNFLFQEPNETMCPVAPRPLYNDQRTPAIPATFSNPCIISKGKRFKRTAGCPYD